MQGYQNEIFKEMCTNDSIAISVQRRSGKTFLLNLLAQLSNNVVYATKDTTTVDYRGKLVLVDDYEKFDKATMEDILKNAQRVVATTCRTTSPYILENLPLRVFSVDDQELPYWKTERKRKLLNCY
jgi:hypothetical protein